MNEHDLATNVNITNQSPVHADRIMWVFFLVSVHVVWDKVYIHLQCLFLLSCVYGWYLP